MEPEPFRPLDCRDPQERAAKRVRRQDSQGAAQGAIKKPDDLGTISDRPGASKRTDRMGMVQEGFAVWLTQNHARRNGKRHVHGSEMALRPTL